MLYPLDPVAGEFRMLTFVANDAEDETMRLRLETVSWLAQSERYSKFCSAPHVRHKSNRQRLSIWKEDSDGTSSREAHHTGYASPQPSQYRFTWGDYAALSYVWGPEVPTETIIVNDTQVEVRQNLASALKSIAKDRRFEGNLRLWVDALCINQEDKAERGQQVAKMKEIYNMAWDVISWIGDEAEESPKAFQLLRVLSEHRDHRKATTLIKELERNPERLGAGCWLALQNLVDRPYWSRLWIIQEVVMGCVAVTIRCGDKTISWPIFLQGIEALHRQFWIVKDQLINHDWRQQGHRSHRTISVRSLHLLFKDLKPLSDSQTGHSRNWASLSRLIDISASCESVDPRDKVYGMLAMMDPAITERINPDYLIQPKDVFTNVAIAAFETYGNLEFLRECNMWGGEGGPTWAPDWTWPLRNRDGRFREGAYQASRSRACNLRIDRDNLRLRCQAIVVDTLDGIGGRRATRFEYVPHSVIQADSSASIYGGIEATKQALVHALAGDSSWTAREDTEARMSILCLPSTFEKGLTQFRKYGWHNAVKNEGYYYCWEEWRHANRDLCVGGQKLDDYFEPAIPCGMTEQNCWQAKGEFERMTSWRRFATTSKGYIGWVPEFVGGEDQLQVKQGDVVAVILGCTTPILLRKCGDYFKVIGEAYFIGLMVGEAIGMLEQGQYKTVEINLI